MIFLSMRTNIALMEDNIKCGTINENNQKTTTTIMKCDIVMQDEVFYETV